MLVKDLEGPELEDVLVATKLVRFRRNTVDIGKAIEYLEETVVRTHYQASEGIDLTNSACKMTTHVYF